uniref:subtilisin n=1 Tax=Alexandrium catenella TaxID=2925 RepID=A0A7S1QLV7_ALECA
MWRRMLASSPPHCALVLALAALLPLAATVAGSAEVAGEGEAELPAAALDRGDECSTGSSEVPSCSLNALQLRRAKRSRDGVRSAGEGAAGEGDRSGAFESAPAFQGSWSNEGRCAEDVPHELFFVMNHAGSARIDEMVLDRARPGSPNFRKWLSKAEVRELTRNGAGARALRASLVGHGSISVVEESAGGELLRARAPISTWEHFLDTEFSTYRHKDSGKVLVRAPAYSLPAHLHEHVAGVLRAVDLGEMVRVPTLELADATVKDSSGPPPWWNCSAEARVVYCDTVEELERAKGPVVTPTVLREVYNIPPVAPRGSASADVRRRTSQMVYASLGQHWSPSDRTQFQRAFNIPQDRYVRQLDMGDGFSSDQLCHESPNECIESNLDVQYMMAMSPWSAMGYFYMPRESTMHEFLEKFVNDMSQIDEPPSVISISYGMPEIGATVTAVKLFNSVAVTLALQGVTILVASGDDGAASAIARNRRHGECWIVEILGLQADWPASSPWVTGVGASLGAASRSPEVVCSVNATGPAAEAAGKFPPLITSGGGFSELNARPDWQEGHHQEVGRGVPDISLAGHAYAIVIGRKWLTVDGTSASSPAFGGMVSLINAERLQKGLPRVGFLNPLLYRNQNAFRDITVGDNRCAAHGAPCCGGYDAKPGWDAASGLGTVDYARLAEVLATENVIVEAPTATMEKLS